MAAAYTGDDTFAQDTDASHTVNQQSGLDYLERRYTGGQPNLAAFLATVTDAAGDPEGTSLAVKQRGRKIEKVDQAYPTVTITLCGRLDGSTVNTPTLAVDSRSIKTFQVLDATGRNISMSCYQYQTVYTYAVYGTRPTTPQYVGPTSTETTIALFDIHPVNFVNPVTQILYVKRCTDLNVEEAGAWFEVREVWVATGAPAGSDGIATVGVETGS